MPTFVALMFCIGEKFVFAVENSDFSSAIQSSLAGNSRSRTASTEKDDFLARNVDAIFAEIVDKANAIGVVTDQFTVFYDNRIDSPDQLSCRRQFIEILGNCRLAGHGNVEAAEVQCADCLDNSRELIDLYIESEVSGIDAEAGKGVIIHNGRAGMTDRGPE